MKYMKCLHCEKIATCGHCGQKIPEPTYLQIRAYYLVYVTGHTQEEAAKVLGISQAAVSQHIEKMRKLILCNFRNLTGSVEFKIAEEIT